MPEANRPELLPALPWERRHKGVLSLPGGYDGYLNCLKEVFQFIQDSRPRPDELRGWLQDRYSLTAGSADQKISFFLKLGLLERSGDLTRLAEPSLRWLETGDEPTLIAQMHSVTRFIGEMLNELSSAQAAGSPLKNPDLLRVANERYGCGWSSATQIDNRRGWLQSAGLITAGADKRLEVTQAGQDLLNRLEIYTPPPVSASPVTDGHPSAQDEVAEPAAEPRPETAATTESGSLVAELRASAVDSSNPTRFELAVRDAFKFLGFRAEQLGGSGKTDVLLDAPRGKNHSFRVTVDTKSVRAHGASKGQLRDQQVDWVTLQEHRTKHAADYSLLIGPDPTGERIFSRGREFDVAIMSSDELAQLCLQHEKMPLGLGDYESLFTRGGAVDSSPVDEKTDEAIRRRDLAEAVSRALIDECSEVGPMSARDLWLGLRHEEHAWTEDEIAEMLRILSSDLVGVVDTIGASGETAVTYIPATSLGVAQLRLRKLADALGSREP